MSNATPSSFNLSTEVLNVISTAFDNNTTANTSNSTTPANLSQTTGSNIPVYVVEGAEFDAVSKAILSQQLIPSLVYVCLLLLLGIPGNILVIYVYLFKWNKSTSRIFILALGFYDLTNCVCSLSTEIVLLSRFIDFDLPVYCKVSRFITATINSGSTFILVAIAVDRFRRICRVYDIQIGTTRAKWITFFSFVFAVLTSWPALVLYGTQTIPIPISNSVIVIAKTCLIEDQMLTTSYPLAFVIFLLCGHFIVDLILIILYSCVGKAIFHQRHMRLSMRQHKCVTSSCNQLEISQASATMEDSDEKRSKTNAKSKRPISFLQFRNSTRDKTCTNKTKPKKMRRNLVFELKQSIRNKLSNSPSHSEADDARKIHAGKTTLMLFLVTLGFILSFLPYSILVIIRYNDLAFYSKMSNVGKSTYQLFLRSYLLNSVINPIIYCFVSKQFRLQSKEGLKSLFKK